MTTGDDPDPSTGAALRQAREGSGLSVEQVSDATRIRPALVRDLEADRVGSSGGAVYARGHVRALAVAVGADASALVARFDEEQARRDARVAEPLPGPVAPRALAGSPLAMPVEGRPERTTPRWGLAAATVLVVVVAVLVVALVRSPSRTPGPVAAVLPTASPQPSVASPRPTATPVRVTVNGAQLQLLVAGGASWVSITGATGLLFQGVLPDGTTRAFHDEARLLVKVGNAGAVSLGCAGHTATRAGASGKVVHFSCTRAGLVPA